MEPKKINSELATDFGIRFMNRLGTFAEAVAQLQISFITDGDTPVEAKQKATDLSNWINDNTLGEPLASYWSGNTQRLIDAVNACALSDMTDAKKLIVTDILSQV